MKEIDRRTFVKIALAIGATAAFGDEVTHASRKRWRERRDKFPEGVASGDPDSTSVLLWTRCPQTGRRPTRRLRLEVAEDRQFERVVATARPRASAASDWTCRVLVGGLRPASIYWYRFSDEDGDGSRIGRTITAPDPAD